MPPNGSPPPLPDGRGGWIHDTPRPTSPPPPRKRRAFITYEYDGIDDYEESLARDGLQKLRKAVEQLRKAGCTGREIERAIYEAMRDTWKQGY